MAALTQDRATKRRDGVLLNFPVASGVTIFAGSIVALNSIGFAVPGSTATTLKVVGRAAAQVAGGASNGLNRIDVEPGTFLYANSASGDLIELADVNNHCWLVDDQTVAKTHASNSRSIAGRIADVTSEGVWVELGRRGLN